MLLDAIIGVGYDEGTHHGNLVEDCLGIPPEVTKERVGRQNWVAPAGPGRL